MLERIIKENKVEKGDKKWVYMCEWGLSWMKMKKVKLMNLIINFILVIVR